MRSHVSRNPWQAKTHTWCVDATAGAAANCGNAAAPIQTIATVNALPLRLGDRVLLKRGETWSGTDMAAPASGRPGRLITFGAYGSGALPIIIGSAGNNCITANGKSHLRFENLEANANDSCSHGFDVSGDHIYLAGCTAHNATAQNILAYGAAATVHDIVIASTISYSGAEQGIFFGAAAAPGPVNVELLNLTVYSNGTDTSQHHGIYVQRCTNSRVADCISYSNSGCGIGTNGVIDSIFERNRLYSNNVGFQDGGSDDPTHGNIWRNNLSYSNARNATYAGSNASSSFWYHNTLVNGSSRGFYHYGSGATGLVMRNNVIRQDGAVVGIWGVYPVYFLETADMADTVQDNNCILYDDTGNGDTVGTEVPDASYTWAEFQALGHGPEANGINVDPVFVTEFTDLHLQVTSPCSGEGATGLGVVADYDSVVRGSPPDIGALEYVA